MGKIVQICPVGHEIKRVIFGINNRPASTVYLLAGTPTSNQPKLLLEKYDQEVKEKRKKIDEKFLILAKLSRDFAISIKRQLGDRNVVIRNCSFVRFVEIIKDLCDIIKEILDEKKDTQGNELEKPLGEKIEKIYINASTANKNVALAASFIASFCPEIINVFCVEASNYTVNLLFKEEVSKDEMKEIYMQHGITYSMEQGDYLWKDYDIEDIPVIPFEKYSDREHKILIHLYNKTDTTTFESEWSKYRDLHKDLVGKEITSVTSAQAHTFKSNYKNFIHSLKKKKLVEIDSQGKHRIFRLTKRGIIVGMILNSLSNIL